MNYRYQQMIDKFIYKCCDVLDRYSDWVNSIFMPKPRKKNERHKSNRKISARTIQKS